MNTSNLSIPALQCPHCRGKLVHSDGDASVTCTACEARFPTPYGLIDFSHDAEFYWGELEREAMQRLLATEGSVEAALQVMLREEKNELREYLTHYALDRFRAGWKFLCELPPDGCLLDFGCGWGSLALSLAEHAAETWVCDVVPERVEMVRRRARDRGPAPVRGCVASGYPNLPFTDQYFDLIILNGVFEWVPSSIPGDPARTQQAFLHEIARVLKPQGQLYVGIENRFGFGYFRGKREEHTKLRFISLLPRLLGRLYHRLAKSAPYKEYTYGRLGMKKILRRAGFQHVDFFYPFPDYREFQRVIDLEDPEQIAASFSPQTSRGKLAFAVAKRTNLLRYFAASFGVLTTPQPNQRNSFINRLLAAHNLPGPYRVRRYQLKGSGNILVQLASGTALQLLTLPIDRTANRRLQRELQIREQLASQPLSPALRQWIPQPIASGEMEGVTFKLEEYLSATPADRETPSAFLAPAVAAIGELHRGTLETGAFNPTEFFDTKWIDEFLAEVGGLDQQPSPVWASRRSTRTAWFHGDFHLGNLLQQQGQFVAIVDWDLAGPRGLPAWDLLNLLCHADFEQGRSWSEAYRRACDRLLAQDADFLRDYTRGLELSPSDLRLAMLTYPLLQWKNKMLHGDRRGTVITGQISATLQQHLAFLEACPDG